MTTEKDAVKLERWNVPLYVLEIEFVVTEGMEVLAALFDALPRGRVRRERESLHEGLHG